jgi:hypothetical protein
VGGLRHALQHLSKKGVPILNVLYEVYFDRIRKEANAEKWQFVYRIFSWITLARRLLTVEELGCALAIEDGMARIHPSSRVPENDILQASGGLVTVRKDGSGKRTVQFDRS